jgi:hypothetical protein
VHIKNRGGRANLYKSTWVKKGTEGGNTHGFSRQAFVGSLPVDAEAIPDDIKSRLSSEELAFVERAVIGPARVTAEMKRREAEHRLKDPLWRLEDAGRLLREAAALSVDAHVPQGRLKAVADALAAVKAVGGAYRPDVRKEDFLATALDAIRSAARAIQDGHYGNAPAEGVRRSKVYADWIEITREVEGTGRQEGLLRALQRTGWVKSKGR